MHLPYKYLVGVGYRGPEIAGAEIFISASGSACGCRSLGGLGGGDTETADKQLYDSNRNNRLPTSQSECFIVPQAPLGPALARLLLGATGEDFAGSRTLEVDVACESRQAERQYSSCVGFL